MKTRPRNEFQVAHLRRRCKRRPRVAPCAAAPPGAPAVPGAAAVATARPAARPTARTLSGAATVAVISASAVLAASAVLTAVSPGPAAAQQAAAPFTIEQVLSAPFPSGLVAAPAGDRVAWVRSHRGVRDIWVAEAPDWRGRALTNHAEDIGQDLENLQFTPDGRRLLYGVGGSPNRSGDLPNPASLPGGPEQALYVIDVTTGERRRIPGGANRALSPDGSRYLFTRGDQIMVGMLDGDAEPELLFRVRRGASELVWSPDGGRVAFVSRRGDHSFVGVYDDDAARITWLAPSVDHDRNPVWSPKGDRLAFIRVPNSKDDLPFIARPESLPWSIHVADPRTGDATEVFRAGEGRGSAFWGGLYGPSLIWARDRLIFPWERTGWLQLWSLPASAPTRTAPPLHTPTPLTPTPLTPGAHEVQWVTLAAGGDELLVSSNQDDIDRRHIWRVPIDGNAPPQLLTPGDGIEWEPVSLADSAIAFLASRATMPARAEILVAGERRSLARSEAFDGEAEAAGAPGGAGGARGGAGGAAGDAGGAPGGAGPGAADLAFPAEHLVVPAAVRFPAADGMEIPGQLFLPPERCGEGPHPGLLFFHGGSRRQMLLGFHHRGYYHNTYAFNQYMANRCFVVLSVNFRSGVGYGLDFREAKGYGAGGASELNDVIGAARWLGSRSDVDAARIGLWGGSYGGYLTALGLARAPDLFAAGVDIHGVHDWNVGIANFVDYDPTARPEVARMALESSPVFDLDRWEDPVLLIHGDDDRNVRFSETVDLAEALRRRGVHVETLVFPDEVHGFLLWRNWVRAFEAASEFLVRELGGG